MDSLDSNAFLAAGPGHFHGIFNGIDKAQLVAVALACMVEIGTMVHAGADDGQAEGDIDTLHGLPLLALFWTATILCRWIFTVPPSRWRKKTTSTS